MTPDTNERQIGVIGVDAGLCWNGDPCYVVAKDSSDSFATWGAFCDQLNALESDNGTTQFSYKRGHPGLGVCVSSGYGDGVYPVYATFKDGRVQSVRVVFFGDDEVDA